MEPRIALFIPTFQSEATVLDVLKKIPTSVLPSIQNILIFDNVSTDQTRAIVKKFASENGQYKIRLFKNEQNYLLGGSTVLALKLAIDEGYDYLICMHSDGQADPVDLLSFVKYCREDKYDFILGSRLLPTSQHEEYSKLRWLVNWTFAKLQQPMLKETVYDLGAFIGFNLKTLKNLPFTSVQPDMAYHPHLILTLSRISKRPFRFKEFPIKWGKVTSSHVNVMSYGLKHISRLVGLYLSQPNVSVDWSRDMKSTQIL